MRPRFAAKYVVYNDDEWLPCSVASIYDAVDAVYFFVSEYPWRGPKTDNTATLDCIASLPDPDAKIHLVKGSWREEVQQRNDALERLQKDGFDYAFIIDADEIYDSHAVLQMIQYACARPEIGCWHAATVIYWKSPYFRIDPPERYHPPIFLKIGTGKFIEYCNCRSHSHELMPPQVGFQHHMSYARTDAQILKKITSFSHSHQVRPDWYEKVWLAWDHDHSITDLCPYNPGAYERAVEVPPAAVPPAVWEHLKRRNFLGVSF